MKPNVEAIVKGVQEAAAEYFQKHQMDTKIAEAITLLALDRALITTHLSREDRLEIFGIESEEDLYLDKLLEPLGITSGQRGGITARFLAIVRLAEKKQWESANQPPDIKNHPGYVEGGGPDTIGWLANQGEDPLKTDDPYRPRKKHRPR